MPDAAPKPGSNIVSPPRRSFIEFKEVGPLLPGVLLGDPRAYRRILGARRGGRFGLLLGSLSLLAAAGLSTTSALALFAHIAAGVLISLSGVSRLGIREHQRLSLWSATPPLCLVVFFQLAGMLDDVALWPTLIAVLAGQGILLRGLGPEV
ncbi:MAG: hypothetical protein GY725_18680 [bacterium]|nr:hypothetical protein [bacterium]